MRQDVSIFICAVAGLLVLMVGRPVSSQQQPSTQQQNPSGTTESTPGSTKQAPPTGGARGQGGRAPDRRPGSGRPGNTRGQSADNLPEWSATVEVVDGLSGEPISRTGVELKASRPRGPFEPSEPEAAETWTAATGGDGKAQFEGLSAKVIQQGLEVYASTRQNGIEFKSERMSPGKGIDLKIEVYPRGTNVDAVRIEELRTVVEPWEDYLVLTQFWQVTLDGEVALDTDMLEGEKYEKGLPFALPQDAKGIHAFGPGETEVVESTVHWRGVLHPGKTVSLRTRYSISLNSSTFTHNQTVNYPTDDLQVLVPLQTDHEKIGRLDNVKLSAADFESVEATSDVPGFRRDKGYLYAHGRSLDAGEAFAFRVTGLPLGRSTGPWIALGLGLLGMVLIFAFSARDREQLQSEESRSAAIATLREERDALLDELADLEAARENEDVSEVTYETEALRLRERLSLIMRKLEDLESDAGS